MLIYPTKAFLLADYNADQHLSRTVYSTNWEILITYY